MKSMKQLLSSPSNMNLAQKKRVTEEGGALTPQIKVISERAQSQIEKEVDSYQELNDIQGQSRMKDAAFTLELPQINSILNQNVNSRDKQANKRQSKSKNPEKNSFSLLSPTSGYTPITGAGGQITPLTENPQGNHFGGRVDYSTFVVNSLPKKIDRTSIFNGPHHPISRLTTQYDSSTSGHLPDEQRSKNYESQFYRISNAQKFQSPKQQQDQQLSMIKEEYGIFQNTSTELKLPKVLHMIREEFMDDTKLREIESSLKKKLNIKASQRRLSQEEQPQNNVKPNQILQGRLSALRQGADSVPDQRPILAMKSPTKFLIDDTFDSLQSHLKSIIRRLEEHDHLYGDPDGPDLGIWDPRLNIKKKKVHLHHNHQRSKSTQQSYMPAGASPPSMMQQLQKSLQSKIFSKNIDQTSSINKEPTKASMTSKIKLHLGKTQQNYQINQNETPLSALDETKKFRFISTLKRLVIKNHPSEQISTMSGFNLHSPRTLKKTVQQQEDEADIYLEDLDDEREMKFDPEQIAQMQATFMSNLALMHKDPIETRFTKEEISAVIQSMIDKELSHIDEQMSMRGAATDQNIKLDHTQKGNRKKDFFDRIAHNIMSSVKFGDLMKNAFQPKLYEELQNDIRFKYFISCRHEAVNVLPILHKIKNRTLNLTNYTLNGSLARALGASIPSMDQSFSRVLFDTNGLQDEDFASLLTGFLSLQALKSLVYIRNEFMSRSLESLKPLFTAKVVPHHLEELRLINCGHLNSTIAAQLLDCMIEKCHIRKLSLVNAGINDQICMDKLTRFVQNQRQLIDLDLSWNKIRPQIMLGFLDVLGDNRTLQMIDLSFNNLMDKAELSQFNGGPPQSEEVLSIDEEHIKKGQNEALAKRARGQQVLTVEETQAFVTAKLIKFIKQNHNLQHLDLSNTNLSELSMRAICIALRRAKSLLSLHLSNIPGLTQGLKDQIFTRLRCGSLLPELFMTEHSGLKQETFDKAVNYCIDKHMSLEELVTQGFELGEIQRTKRQLDQCSHSDSNNQTIIQDQKMLIFQRMTGHKVDIPGSGRWKMISQASEGECWLCERLTYSLIFWSDDIAQKTECWIDPNDRESIVGQLKLINPHQEEIHAPVLYGSFTNWVARPMMKLKDFCAQLEKPNIQEHEILEILKQSHRINGEAQTLEDLDPLEKFQYKKFIVQQEQKRYSQWKDVLDRYIRYRRPFQVSQQYVHIPHLIDVKQKQQQFAMKYQKTRLIHPDEQEFQKQESIQLDIAHDKQNDVYVFAAFIKPGRHNYIVKNASHHHFHKIIAPIREEDVPPYTKTSKSTYSERVFKKDASVFREWKEDTEISLKTAQILDLKQWKASRFVKDEDDLERCTKLIEATFVKLKDIFINLACTSSFPNITMIDFSAFCEKCSFFDHKLTLSTIDRLFIATNYEIEDNAENPDRALNRFEFFEILIRIANVKFRETGIVHSYSDALEKLLKEHVLVNYEVSQWQTFRDRELWTIEVNDILEANSGLLFQIYQKFFDSRKKYMTMQEAFDLVMHQTPLNLNEKAAMYCYGMSKMSVVDESEDIAMKYKRILYVEFLEMIGRIADYKFKGAEMSKIPLAQKIEYVLDDLLTFIGAKRKDVEIELEEESQSDDEY